ncbi:phage tail tube protein [Oceanobacillus neutriphilus]|uniref:Major tail shaft protein, phage associated n=1 Tax=Oceanobacillus neutriphilus TaxID=531815 RepID=A0ABQ2P288_9BACI|nr:phage tail protein [Oceanobacillus neutriphilus]GGP16229.1 putative major tail shaft protein, phage associated [Oceanobacillus neutriphilus]
MAKFKNALRGHFIQPYEVGQKEPSTDEWLELAEWITDISDDTNEETEDIAYYSGDGTPETEVTSVAMGYSFEGTYDSEDAAQAHIAGLRFKLGQGRKVWHRVVSADGKEEFVGRATVSAIVAGSGAASDYEAFSCTIRFDQLPKVNKLDDGNGDGGSGE